jgi:GMP synthase-like glutamine amidotransferase
MRLHVLQHAPFEGPGLIARWADEHGHPLAVTRLDLGQPLPSLDAFDLLVVMGGPMNVDEEERYPWLSGEKRLVAAAVAASRKVLGICHRHREIGWFPVRRAPGADSHPLAAALPDGLIAFHWHGDTFELPPGTQHLFASDATPHQGFALGAGVVGLQFHPEVDRAAVEAFIRHGADELAAAPFVQNAAQMLADPARFAALANALPLFLGALAAAQ